MIRIEDSNNEQFHINPEQVIYVKERVLHHPIRSDTNGYKILLSNSEVIITSNKEGAEKIIECINRKCGISEEV